MIDPDIPSDFERAILLGLSRLPSQGTDADGHALTVLSLLAQRKRHRRAAANSIAPNALAAQLSTDPRKILPEAARRPLLRLATSIGKEGWSYIGTSVFERLEKKQYRLHPFDLPRLEQLLTSCLDRLGVAERAWLALRNTSPMDENTGTVEHTEADWILLPKAAKIAYITQLRRRQPDEAREWVERNLTSAPADVRVGLVGALETALQPDDIALLEKIAKDDRAASVRDAAEELLAATRGSGAYDRKLKDATTLIELGRTLLGRRTAKLNTVAVAAAVKHDATAATTGARAVASAEYVYKAFQHLYFSDIARAMALAPADLALALPADDGLAPALAIAAVIEGDPQVLAKLSAHLARFDPVELIGRFASAFQRLPKEARASLLRTAAQSPVLQWHSPHELQALGRLAGGELPEELARKLIASAPWIGSLQNAAYQIDATTLAVFASLMPPSCEGEFLASVASLSPKSTAAAFEFISFTTALEGPAA